MLRELNIFNRPISPHLLIYSAQISSVFSIWHRITSIFLIFSLICHIINLKRILIFNFSYITIFDLNIFLWLITYIYVINLFVFLYHSLNGIRHIFWDLNFLLGLKKLIFSTIIFLFFLFIILISNLVKF